MTWSTLIFILAVLACPLMMIMMMRGHGHGHGGHRDAHHHAGGKDGASQSTDELRRQRAEIDRLIGERESEASRERRVDAPS